MPQRQEVLQGPYLLSSVSPSLPLSPSFSVVLVPLHDKVSLVLVQPCSVIPTQTAGSESLGEFLG